MSKTYVNLITGHIGAGKSSVANELRKKGYIVIDTDRLRKDVFLTDPEIRAVIFGKFGLDAIDWIGGLSQEVRDMALADYSVYKWIHNVTAKTLRNHLERVLDTIDSEKDIFIEASNKFDWIYSAFANKFNYIHYNVVVSDTVEQVARVVKRYQTANKLYTEQPCSFYHYSEEQLAENKKKLVAYEEMVWKTIELQKKIDESIFMHDVVFLRNDEPDSIDKMVDRIMKDLE